MENIKKKGLIKENPLPAFHKNQNQDKNRAEKCLPPEPLSNWLIANQHFLESGQAILSGRSLKFFRSQIPEAIFLANRDFLARLADPNTEEARRHGLLLLHASEKKVIMVLENQSETEQTLDSRTATDEDQHASQQDSGLPAPGQTSLLTFYGKDDCERPVFTIDTLIFDINDQCWSGTALPDLQAEKLDLLITAVDQSEIIKIAAQTSMLNFTASEATIELLKQSFDQSEAEKLNRRFLNRQFQRLICGAKPSSGFLLLDKIEALEWFLPELARGKNLSQNKYHKYDIFFHSLYVCDAVEGPDLPIRLAGLFHDLGKVDTRKVKSNGEASFHNHEVISARHTSKIMKRFGFDKDLTDRVRFLVRNHMFHYTDEWTDKAIRRFINKVDPDTLEDLIRLRLADRKGSGKRSVLPKAIQQLIRHIEEVRTKESALKIKDLAINGHDLMEMGMPAGKQMGDVLKHLLLLVKDNSIANDTDILKEEAENWIRKKTNIFEPEQ